MLESVAELLFKVNESPLLPWETIMRFDAEAQGYSLEESRRRMEEVYNTMKLSIERYDGSLRSNSGFVGGDGALM